MNPSRSWCHSASGGAAGWAPTWVCSPPDRLCDRTRILVEDARNALLVSAASAWEIALKYRLGKLPLPEPPASYVPDRMGRSGTTALPVEHAQVLRTADLPDHHEDPFDRIRIAQAQLLGLTIITADEQLSAYDVAVVAA